MSTAKTKGVQHLISLSIRRCSAVSDSPGTPQVSSPIMFSSLAPGWVPRGDRDFGMVVTKHPAPHCPLHPVLCSGSVPAPSTAGALGCIHENQTGGLQKGCWVLGKGRGKGGFNRQTHLCHNTCPKAPVAPECQSGRKTGGTSNKDLNYFLNMRFQCP